MNGNRKIGAKNLVGKKNDQNMEHNK